MKRTYVTFTANIDGLKKNLVKTMHYNNPVEVSLELGKIRTHGWFENVSASEMYWYPPTSIKWIRQETFEE
jgi:hypothetical protein